MKSFICTNILFDGKSDRYITSEKQIYDIQSNNIFLRCYVDDFFAATKCFDNIDDKIIKYQIIISESVIIDNYNNLFDVFNDLIKYKDSITCINLILASRVNNNDFNKMLNFFNTVNKDFKLNLKIGNINVFSIGKLLKLKNLNINTTIELNQSYDGRFPENNDQSNLFTYDSLIETKSIVEDIASKAIQQGEDIPKILFIYRYIGKKVKYDYKMAEYKGTQRRKRDWNSIYNVLVKQKGVCSSIATTFRILMEAIGIESQVVSSDTHEWNVVKINGLWYHLDLTWDLNNIKSNKPLEFFLKSEKAMTKNRSHHLSIIYTFEDNKAPKSITQKKYQLLK